MALSVSSRDGSYLRKQARDEVFLTQLQEHLPVSKGVNGGDIHLKRACGRTVGVRRL